MTNKEAEALVDAIDRALSPDPSLSLQESLESDYYGAFEDGSAKANRVFEHLETIKREHPDLPAHRIAYVSIGGANGSELAAAFSRPSVCRGLLVEYDSDVIHNFPAKLKEQLSIKTANRIHEALAQRQIRLLTGDAWSRKDEVNRLLRQWFSRNEVTLAVFSVQSVLHELPARTDTPQYTHSGFLSRLFDELPAFVFICKEPTGDSEWTQEIDFDAGREDIAIAFRKLATQIADLYPKVFGSTQERSITRQETQIRTGGPLALETAKKIIYSLGFSSLVMARKIRYELGECHQMFDRHVFSNECEGLFPPKAFSITRLASDNFQRAWKRSGFSARSAQTRTILSIPVPFAEAVGYRYKRGITVTNSDAPTELERNSSETSAKQKYEDFQEPASKAPTQPPEHDLTGLWDLFSWPVPAKSPSCQGLSASGYLALFQITNESWSGIMSHTLDETEFWEDARQRTGEPPFRAWYDVTFVYKAGKFGGTSRMLLKEYIDPEVEARFKASGRLHYLHRGAFSRSYVKEIGGVAHFRGFFETSRGTGSVRFDYTSHKLWQQVASEVAGAIPFHLSQHAAVRDLAQRFCFQSVLKET